MASSAIRVEDVLKNARKALKANPRDATLHGMVAQLLEQLERHYEAVPHLAFLIQRETRPSEELYARYAKALQRSYATETSYDAISRGLASHPHSSVLLRSKILTCLMSRKWDEARDTCERLRAIDPQDEYTAGLAGTLKLLATDMREGWDDYAKRPHDKMIAGLLGTIPRWGGESLEGKRLVLWSEQGIGDVVMFLGYLPWIVAKGAAISVIATAKLATLVSRSFPEVEVVSEGGLKSLASYDFQMPVGDLLQHARNEFAPATHSPYLRADEQRTQELRARYLDHAQARGRDRIVGLSWHTTNPFVGFTRNVALEELQPLLTLPGVQFVSLQYGEHAEEIAQCNFRCRDVLLVDPAIDAFNNLDGLAAQMAALDGIITIDNATVHLAGALGVPTTLLLSTMPDWRWGLQGNDCCWYRSIHLERQEALSKWKPVIQRVRRRLMDGAP